MKAMTDNSGQNRISSHGDLGQRQIRERICGRVPQDPVPELNPRVSREGTAISPNADPDAMPDDSVSVEHSAESDGTRKTKRAKDAIARRSIDRRRDSLAGQTLHAGRTDQLRRGLGSSYFHELTQGSKPPHRLRAQQGELGFTDVTHFGPASTAQSANSDAEPTHAAVSLLS